MAKFKACHSPLRPWLLFIEPGHWAKMGMSDYIITFAQLKKIYFGFLTVILHTVSYQSNIQVQQKARYFWFCML